MYVNVFIYTIFFYTTANYLYFYFLQNILFKKEKKNYHICMVNVCILFKYLKIKINFILFFFFILYMYSHKQ